MMSITRIDTGSGRKNSKWIMNWKYGSFVIWRKPNAPFIPWFWWSKLFPCTTTLCSVTSALHTKTQGCRKNCVVATWENLFFSLSFSHTYCTRQYLLLCLLLVRNDICFELQWVRVTHIVAASCFGLRSPPRVLTGANVCWSWLHQMVPGDSWTNREVRLPLIHTVSSRWHKMEKY